MHLLKCTIAGTLLALSASFLTPAVAKDVATVSGVATVVDGDTLKIDGQRIRLVGIDAPESHQTCQLGTHDIDCGKDSTAALTTFIAGQTVQCHSSSKDVYKRLLASCDVGGTDIGEWMVEHGHAIAFRRYSTQYVPAEQRAQTKRIGIWATNFDAPDVWRRAHKGH